MREKVTPPTKHKKLPIILIALLALLLLAVCGVLLLLHSGRGALRTAQSYDTQPFQEALDAAADPQDKEDEPDDSPVEEGVVVYQGERYRYNDEIITLLFLGIDTNETVEIQEIAGTGGQADTIFLLVLDPKNERIRMLGVSRDTMTDIELYDLNGNYMGTDRNHLALAYAYGDGAQKSCELTEEAVSNLFFQMPIHGYCSINISAIEILNDLVGGVTVTVTDEDLEAIGFTVGETLTLDAEQAESYIRWRPDKDSVSNGRRMERQKDYAWRYIQQAKKVFSENVLFPVQAVQAVSPYMVTDLSVSEISYLATLATGLDFSIEDIQMVEGLETTTEIHDEFYASDSALYELILEVFYEKE